MKFKIGAALSAFLLLAGAGILGLTSGPGTASAAPVTITFTWWVTNAATGTVEGTTAGALGSGTLTGQFLAYNAGPPQTSTILYDLKGSAHSMTISADGKDAAVTAKVTAGWLEGQTLTGSVIAADPCAKSATGTCYTTSLTGDDPSASTTAPGGGTTTTAPAVGTGLAPAGTPGNGWFRVGLVGLALALAGAAGFGVTTLRRSPGSPRR